jgi:intermediate cleaving peptidase 55
MTFFDFPSRQQAIQARTFPASGTFSPPQRDLYSAVLATQKQMISLCSESAGYSQQDLHHKSCEILKAELNQIGFNLGKEGDLERVLFPHYLGHHIGIGTLSFRCMC